MTQPAEPDAIPSPAPTPVLDLDLDFRACATSWLSQSIW